MLPCGLCKEKFFSYDDLRDHLERHKSKMLQENEIKSEQDSDQDFYDGSLILDCVKEEEQLQGHKEETQNGERELSSAETFMCPKCPYKTMSKRYFKEHMDRKHLNKFKCDQCPKRYPVEGRLKNHIREKHMKDEDKPKLPEDEFFRITKNEEGYRKLYKCLECSYKTEQKSHIYRHIRSIHRKRLGEVCKPKGMVNDNDEGEKDSSSEIFMCSNCSYKSTSKRKFKTHMNVMHLNKYKCEHCPKRFHSEGILANHIREKHEEEDKSLLPEDEFFRRNEKGNGKPNRKRYECLKCTFKTDDRTHIYRHIRGIHRNLLDELYKSKGMALDNDAGYHKCTKCDFKTLHRFNLRTHIKIVHQKGRDYVCDLCKEVYPIKGYLKRHMEMVHISAESSKLLEGHKSQILQKTEIKSEQDSDEDSYEGSLILDCVKEEEQLQVYDEEIRNGEPSEAGDKFRTLHERESSSAGTFMCSKCPYKTTSKRYFKEHMNVMHLNKFKCDQCPKKYPSKGRLAYHIRKKHMKDEGIPKLPEDEFFRITKNKEGKRNRKMYQCLECTYQTEIKCNIYRHIRSVHRKRLGELNNFKGMVNDNDEGERCSSSETFIQIQMRKKHLIGLDSRENICEAKFSPNGELKEHLEGHKSQIFQESEIKIEQGSDQDSYEGSLILDCVKEEEQLQEIHGVDSGEPSFTLPEAGDERHKFHEKGSSPEILWCSKCFFKTINKEHFKRHMNEVHLNKNKCDHCPRKFSSKMCLANHIRDKHMREDNPKLLEDGFRGVKKHKKENRKKYIKKVHQKEQTNVCDLCTRSYSSKEYLLKHIKFIHFKAEPSDLHTCSICSYKTYNKSSLKKHMNMVHLKIRNFTCDLCQMQYSTKFELQRHFGIVHLKKMLRCDGDSKCSFKTTDKQKFLRHIRRVHQKIQGVNCEICGNWYISPGGLSKHKRKHHTEGESIINRSTCDLCQKTYKKKDYLSKHMKKTHLKEIPGKTSTTASITIKSE